MSKSIPLTSPATCKFGTGLPLVKQGVVKAYCDWRQQYYCPHHQKLPICELKKVQKKSLCKTSKLIKYVNGTVESCAKRVVLVPTFCGTPDRAMQHKLKNLQTVENCRYVTSSCN